MFGIEFGAFRPSRLVEGVKGSKMSGSSRFDPSDTPAWFQAVISSRCDRAALRERLAGRRGGECLEFLLVYCGLENSLNPLQRYEHMRTLVHRFVRKGAERMLPLSAKCRERVLAEWAPWEELGRISSAAGFPAMGEAAHEIHEYLRLKGQYARSAGETFASTESRRTALPRRWRAHESGSANTEPVQMSTLVMA